MCFKAKYFMFCCEIFRFQKEIFVGKKQQRGCGFLTATPLLFLKRCLVAASVAAAATIVVMTAVTASAATAASSAA